MQDRQPLAALHRSWSSLAINRAKSGLRPGPVLFLALQLAILALAWRLLGQQGNTPSLHAPAAAAAAGGAAAAAPPGGWRVTSDLNEWSRAPWNLTFKPPQSQCLLHPDGEQHVGLRLPATGGRACQHAAACRPTAECRPTVECRRPLQNGHSLRCAPPHPPPPQSAGTVELAEGWADPERPPFLFDTSSMPLRDTACPHCPADEKPPLCCGVCIFESRRCDGFYPGQGRSEAVAQHMLGSGYNLKASGRGQLFGAWVAGAGDAAAHVRQRWAAVRGESCAAKGQPAAPAAPALVATRRLRPPRCIPPSAARRPSLPASCSSASVAARCGSWETARPGARRALRVLRVCDVWEDGRVRGVRCA